MLNPKSTFTNVIAADVAMNGSELTLCASQQCKWVLLWAAVVVCESKQTAAAEVWVAVTSDMHCSSNILSPLVSLKNHLCSSVESEIAVTIAMMMMTMIRREWVDCYCETHNRGVNEGWEMLWCVMEQQSCRGRSQTHCQCTRTITFRLMMLLWFLHAIANRPFLLCIELGLRLH